MSLVLLVALMPLVPPLPRAGANGRWTLEKRRPLCSLLAAQGKVQFLATWGGRLVQRGLPAPHACAGRLAGTVRCQTLTIDHLRPQAQRSRRRFGRSVERRSSLCGGRCAARRGVRRESCCGG